MNYPVWDVPFIGSVWVVGLISIFHVTISHFAIGGAFYLLMAKRKAEKEGRQDWLDVIKQHSRFFLILTAVFGAVSGIGIWFAIGLANPEGTSTLIHNFVFGWAIEWTFFIVEVASLIVFYYFWDRIPSKTHTAVGWVYAGSAFFSLVIINGILTFMLTPGETWLSVAGTGEEPGAFWAAFFNPTYFPSLVLRTLVCIAIAGVWAMWTASRIDGFAKPALKQEIIRWSAGWLVPGFILMPLAFIWYLSAIPDNKTEMLQLGIDTIGQGTFTIITRIVLMMVMMSATILGIVYFLGVRNSKDFGPGHAFAVVLLGFIVTGSGEYARELLRKPHVVSDYIYSNSIREREVEAFNANGYLTQSPWPTARQRELWQNSDAVLSAERAKLASISAEGDAAPTDADVQILPSLEILGQERWQAHLDRGEMIFRGQCLSCHTREGYRPLTTLMAGRDRNGVRNFLTMMHDLETYRESNYAVFMPPVVGTQDEVEALTDYLTELLKQKSK